MCDLLSRGYDFLSPTDDLLRSIKPWKRCVKWRFAAHPFWFYTAEDAQSNDIKFLNSTFLPFIDFHLLLCYNPIRKSKEAFLCLNWCANPNSCISNQIISLQGNGNIGLLSSVVLYNEIICSAIGCSGINASTSVFLRYVLMYFRPSAVVPMWWG